MARVSPPSGALPTSWRSASSGVIPAVATTGSLSGWETITMAASAGARSSAASTRWRATESRSIEPPRLASLCDRWLSSRARKSSRERSSSICSKRASDSSSMRSTSGSCCSRRERSTSTIRTIATTSAIATALTAAPTAIHVVVSKYKVIPVAIRCRRAAKRTIGAFFHFSYPWGATSRATRCCYHSARFGVGNSCLRRAFFA